MKCPVSLWGRTISGNHRSEEASPMKARSLFVVVPAVLFVAVASAEPPAPGPAAATRELRTEVVVDAPLDAVWAAFTTKEGMESWAVRKAEMDFRVGGRMRTNYNPAATPDGPGWIVHHILTVDPKRMFSGRFDAPANALPAAKRAAEGTWTVTYFDALSPDRTKVTLAHLGFGTGPEWDEAYEFFRKGNAWSLEQMRKKVGRPSGASEAKPGMGRWAEVAEAEFKASAVRVDGKGPDEEWAFRVLRRPRALTITVRRPSSASGAVEEAWFAWWDETRQATRVVPFGIPNASEGTGRWEDDRTLVLEVPVADEPSARTRRVRVGDFRDQETFEVRTDDVRDDGAPTVPRVTRLTKVRPSK
jgi:uncharacterized protein YndB with AHSA1/START domain